MKDYHGINHSHGRIYPCVHVCVLLKTVRQFGGNNARRNSAQYSAILGLGFKQASLLGIIQKEALLNEELTHGNSLMSNAFFIYPS